jgi:hypothetical protein
MKSPYLMKSFGTALGIPTHRLAHMRLCETYIWFERKKIGEQENYALQISSTENAAQIRSVPEGIIVRYLRYLRGGERNGIPETDHCDSLPPE